MIRNSVAEKLLLSMLLAGLAACSSETPTLGQEDSSSDEAEITEEMIAAIQDITRSRTNEGIVPRLNQAKSLGCFTGSFQVKEDLPADLAQGVFEPGRRYQALARFANASTTDDREADFRGLSIKLFGASGDTLWGDEQEQHFLLNSYPALFAEDPAEFLAFIEATADAALWKFFINPGHWDALATIIRGREEIRNPFAIRYWSTVPFRHGMDPQVAVKYSVQSCSTGTLAEPEPSHGDFLRDAMAESLVAGPVCFEFMVQRQTDADAMPIEDASVVWDEEDSPFISVATLRFEDQDFQSRPALLNCEQQTFNPWQSLVQHRPLGGINRVRRAVYSETSRFRLGESIYE